MQATDEFPPKSVTGLTLVDERDKLGVRQAQIARHLGKHRLTIHGWEKAHSVDPMRAAAYRRALREIYAEARGAA